MNLNAQYRWLKKVFSFIYERMKSTDCTQKLEVLKENDFSFSSLQFLLDTLVLELPQINDDISVVLILLLLRKLLDISYEFKIDLTKLEDIRMNHPSWLVRIFCARTLEYLSFFLEQSEKELFFETLNDLEEGLKTRKINRDNVKSIAPIILFLSMPYTDQTYAIDYVIYTSKILNVLGEIGSEEVLDFIIKHTHYSRYKFGPGLVEDPDVFDGLRLCAYEAISKIKPRKYSELLLQALFFEVDNKEMKEGILEIVSNLEDDIRIPILKELKYSGHINSFDASKILESIEGSKTVEDSLVERLVFSNIGFQIMLKNNSDEYNYFKEVFTKSSDIIENFFVKIVEIIIKYNRFEDIQIIASRIGDFISNDEKNHFINFFHQKYESNLKENYNYYPRHSIESNKKATNIQAKKQRKENNRISQENILDILQKYPISKLVEFYLQYNTN